MNQQQREQYFSGWGLVIGANVGDLLVPGPHGSVIDVSGYSEDDYWDGEMFLGADPCGITPVYDTPEGQFPAGARRYPHLA